MRITRWGEYGILCSLYLGSRIDQSSVGAAEIAETQNIPIQYTQQILQRLRKGKIIKSVRGPHGGYRLDRSPELISLRDVLFAAEGHTFEVICESDTIHPERCAEHHTCALKAVWYDLKDSIDKILSQKTLAMLIEMERAQKASNQGDALVSLSAKKTPDDSTRTLDDTTP